MRSIKEMNKRLDEREQEIERLNELVKGLREERDYLFNKTTTESNYEIKRLNNIIKEKDKDFELLRKAQLKKCQEYENLEKLNNANYQSFIEVNNIRNKAIDFLKENACIDEDVEYFCDDLRYDDCKKLLDILQGVDKK